MRVVVLSAAACIGLGLLGGCAGEVGTRAPGGGSTPPGSSTAPGGDPSSNPTLPGPGQNPGEPGVPVVLPSAGALGPIALRRLNNEEYANTVNDLLGITGAASSFVPDDRTLGYKNIAVALTVPPVLAEQYQRAAQALAAQVNVASIAPCADSNAEVACGQSFIGSFGRQAYRRPLTSEESSAYLQLFQGEYDRAGYAAGITAIVELLLQSPHFLYKTEIGVGSGLTRQLTSHEVASQLSYLLTGSMPDSQLAAAADAGQLATPAQREAQVRRLMGTQQATVWLRSFVAHWLAEADVSSVPKDASVFPDYEGAVQSAVAEESSRFIDAIFAEAGGSLATLFTADWTYANDALAGLYGLPNAPGGWQKVTLPATERRGVLTHPAFLAANSKANDSFPITRGKILRTRIMCKAMPLPPPDLEISIVEPSADLTTRERFSLHAQSGSVCASCHTLIDPLGFGFENYDAVGAFRTTENGKPIDPSGEIVGVDPEVDGAFANAIDFSNRIAQSKVLQSCAAREAFRWGLGRADLADASANGARDAAIISAMAARLGTANLDIRELLVALASSEAYPYRSDQ